MIPFHRYPVAAAAFLALFLASCSSSTSTSSSPAASPPGQSGGGSSGGPSVSILYPSGDNNVRWTSLSCGRMGVLALRSDGSLWGWGSMTLGIPYGSSAAVPARIGQDADWIKQATGYGIGSTCGAIKADHSLWTWGTNFCGMIGRPVPDQGSWHPDTGGYRTYYYEYPPTPVGGYDWADVSFAANHVVAVKTDGTLWAWGVRAQGRLGDNTNIPYDFHNSSNNIQPTPMRIGMDNDWVEVQAGDVISVARKSDGTLWRWGDGVLIVPTRVGSPSDRWSTYSVGGDHVLAIRQDNGSLWAWGWNDDGQLGIGSLAASDTPVRVGDGPWKAVGAGSYHSLAVKSDGTLWGFGENRAGKLGTGTQESSLVPVQVGLAADWVSVEAGEEFSTALKNVSPSGELWLWGGNDCGQLGNGYTASVADPTLVSPAGGWSRAYAGGESTFGIRPDGTLWGWGYNGLGNLGDGTTYSRQLPGQVGSDTDWLTAAPGFTHTLALKQDGTLWTWGVNSCGEVGTGDLAPRHVPARLGTDFYRSISAAHQASFAIRTDGTLWAWGLDTYNRLGVGNSFSGTDPVSPAMYVLSPRQVGTGAGWKQVSASNVQTAAVKEDGSLWAWGSISSGLVNSGVPVRVGTDSDWDFVATSGNHTMALKRDGSLWAWGASDAGQLGTGTVVYIPYSGTPVRIGTELWRSVAVRFGLTVAVRQDGTLWGWGGVYQKAPVVPSSGSNVPVRIGSGNQWVSVSSDVDASHWAALQGDGSLYTWGGNRSGQLGNQAAWTPVPVAIP